MLLLALMLFAVVLVVFAPAFAITWVLSARLRRRWLRLLVRCVVVALFWAPINSGSQGSRHFWPVSFSVFEPSMLNTQAPVSIIAATLVLWMLCLAISVARDRNETPG